MTSASKLIQASAGNAAGAGLAVEEVFSTYLYEGNGSTQTITNGIDLDGEGGLVWVKERTDASTYHGLVDTERGNTKILYSNDTLAEATTSGFPSFNSNGFSLALDTSTIRNNDSGDDYASWTFRKAPKFFDVVTYTGDGTSNRQIPHNLGSVPGFITVKATNFGSDPWYSFHRSLGSNTELRLSETDYAITPSTRWANTDPTDTYFVGDTAAINVSGRTYVAYLFAHNDGDGEFGENADQDIIKCGTISGQQTVDIGFEPQWILLKRTDSAGDWRLVDNMRGLTAVNSNDAWLAPNTSAAESASDFLTLNSTGFFSDLNGTYIYIAIRRGPMKTPESGTEVFAMDQLGQTSPTPPGYNSPFPVDLGIQKGTVASNWNWVTRLLDGGFLESNTADAYAANAQFTTHFQNGYRDTTASSTDYYAWMFRRAPGFFDVVAYDGNDTAGHEISHNLGVAPEMMIIKARDAALDWAVYHSGIGNTKYIWLNRTDAAGTSSSYWDNTSPTDSVFTVGTTNKTNSNGTSYIAYLFATLPGVSKVGSYTGNGTSTGDSQVIDCGFSAGARFVLIKRTDLDKDWWVMDTERGIVAGDDALLRLNLANSELSGDIINPNSSGFEVEWRYSATDSANINASGASYIFLAIA